MGEHVETTSAIEGEHADWAVKVQFARDADHAAIEHLMEAVNWVDKGDTHTALVLRINKWRLALWEHAFADGYATAMGAVVAGDFEAP